MSGERTYPVLPCPDLEDAVAFYEALGFHRTFLQLRPYPCAVVAREDLAIHLSGIDGFDPQTSVASVVCVVPDAGALYEAFAAGLRARYGRLPVAGVPRILRPRRKQGTTTGFTLVDPGGTWLRFYAADDVARGEDDDAPRAEGLARAVEVAARQGDARGDEHLALDVLDRALARHPDAPGVDVVRAQAYRVELLVRSGRGADARAALRAARAVVLGDADAAAVAAELAHAQEAVGPDA